MLRLAFSGLLALSAFATGALGSLTLVAPDRLASGFNVTLPEDVDLSLLMAVLGGVLLSLALIVGLAAHWSFQQRPEGRTLGLLCAVTLLLVAVAGWWFGGSREILLLDGVRGVVIFALGWFWKIEEPQARRS